MFDITTQAVADTAAMHVKSTKGELLYDGKKQPVRIVFFSPGTEAFSAMEVAQNARYLERAKENGGEFAAPTPEQRFADQAADLAVVTSHFENLDYPPAVGKAGPALYEALYLDRKLGFVTKQATKFVESWASFLPEPATN